LQPNNPEGINAWQQQLQDWRARNGDGPITAATGFLLHPGGAEPGSGECFLCGQVGHHQDSGRCIATAINSHEHTFHTICSHILHFRPVAQVNAVNNAGGKFDWLHNCMLVPMGNQGNGE